MFRRKDGGEGAPLFCAILHLGDTGSVHDVIDISASLLLYNNKMYHLFDGSHSIGSWWYKEDYIYVTSQRNDNPSNRDINERIRIEGVGRIFGLMSKGFE